MSNGCQGNVEDGAFAPGQPSSYSTIANQDGYGYEPPMNNNNAGPAMRNSLGPEVNSRW